MVRLIAVAAIAFAAATSAQAMSPVPLHQPDGMITQVAFWCGPFRTRVNGVCVARTTTPDPPRRPQVRAMEWRRLRSVVLRLRPRGQKNGVR